MLLKKAIIVNRAPFEKIELCFDKGNIFVMSGINGVGKTTILSHIVDSFYELGKKAFPNEFSDKTGKFYRVSSSIFALNNALPSVVYLCFEHNGERIDYIDLLGKCSEMQWKEILGDTIKISFKSIETRLNNVGAVKEWSLSTGREIEDIFATGLLTYFPAYRYEQPSYLNDPYHVELKFKKDSRFSGLLLNPIEVISDLEDITNWMMDVVLDAELYQGESLLTLNQINEVFSELLMEKVGEPTRIGVGPRNYGGRRIQVVTKNTSRNVYPTVFGMSSGELSQMCMFVELIKQADVIRRKCSNVSGIVVIDEIDKHLHMMMQKETIPNLLCLFPNVQFIISSHSPFLNMGLEDKLPSKYTIFDMDNRGVECSPEQNELFRGVYNSLIEINERYADKYRKLTDYIKQKTKPIIITEGKTDWKHIKSAIRALNIDEFDADFLEFDDTMGADPLYKILQNMKEINPARMVIGIFDRDDDKLLPKLLTDGENVHEFLAGKVYAVVLPLKNEDLYGEYISIEHYYKRNDLMKTTSTGRRLFLGEEFYESGNSKDGKFQTKFSGIANKVKVNGIIDEKVYCKDDLEQKNSIALSKGKFAELIYKEDEFANGFDFSSFKELINILVDLIKTQKK